MTTLRLLSVITLLSAPATFSVAAVPALAGSEAFAVSVNDKGCNPNALEVPEGRIIFRIKNESRRALEWEILQGVMVIAERENIVPGFVQSVSASLTAGEYAMTCGLLSNPRGRLTVLAADNALPAKPSPLDLVGPIAEYKVYVLQEVALLVTATQDFTNAVRSGDLAKAQALYAPTRAHYERIEPVAELFDDLDKAIDVRADDFEKKEEDPAFGGFHRIEMLLFREKSTPAALPYANKLMDSVEELAARVKGLTIPPKNMVGGAADLIEEVAASKISGEEDRYSHTDLSDFQANVDGAQKIHLLLRPLVLRAKPDLVGRIDSNFSKVDTLLAKYKSSEGFRTYDHLTETDRNALKAAITTLAEDLSELRGVLGVE